jgi:hypothetical protein
MGSPLWTTLWDLITGRRGRNPRTLYLGHRSDWRDARDPNAPPERLQALLDSPFWEEVLRNPVLPLLLLDQPDFLRTVSPRTNAWMASSRHCAPAVALWLLGRDDDYLQELVENKHLPWAIRREAFHHLGDFNFNPTFTRPRLKGVVTEEERRLLVRASGNFKGGNPPEPLTDGEIEQLATLGCSGLRLAVLTPRCPGKLLERLQWNWSKTHRSCPTGVRTSLRVTS